MLGSNMKLPVIGVGGNIGVGKTTLFQKFQESQSCVDKFKVRAEHEPIGELENIYGNKLINPLEQFNKDPVANAFIFQNYVLDV